MSMFCEHKRWIHLSCARECFGNNTLTYWTRRVRSECLPQRSYPEEDTSVHLIYGWNAVLVYTLLRPSAANKCMCGHSLHAAFSIHTFSPGGQRRVGGSQVCGAAMNSGSRFAMAFKQSWNIIWLGLEKWVQLANSIVTKRSHPMRIGFITKSNPNLVWNLYQSEK